MIYVMTGLNGDIKKYHELKDSLFLRKTDDLFILGGILGAKGGLDILLETMSEENVFPIAGKQELAALKFLDYMENKLDTDDITMKKEMVEWFRSGGMPIAENFRALEGEKKEMILDYLREDFTIFEELSAGGNEFVLAYAGLGDFDPDREIDEYSPEDLTAGDYTPNCYYDDKYIVCGCLEDYEPEEDGCEDKIYHSENVIVLNHSANIKPCCIRLDDLREYYGA